MFPNYDAMKDIALSIVDKLSFDIIAVVVEGK
jgi:hypothetical protein